MGGRLPCKVRPGTDERRTSRGGIWGSMARVLVLAGFAPSLVLFRSAFLRELVRRSHEVLACAPPDENVASVLLVHPTLADECLSGVRHGPRDFLPRLLGECLDCDRARRNAGIHQADYGQGLEMGTECARCVRNSEARWPSPTIGSGGALDCSIISGAGRAALLLESGINRDG